MRKICFVCLFCLLLPLLLNTLSGCGTTKSVFKKIAPGNDGLKKQVMIVPLIDQARLGPQRTAQISAEFFKLLRKSPQLLLHQYNQSITMPTGIKSTEFGSIIDPELLKKAEELGMNAVIIGILNPFEVTTRKTGIWPFREVSSIVEFSMVVNVFDTVSSCLYLTQLESEEMAFPIDELQARNEQEVIDQILEEKMPPILKRQSSAAIETLENEPWSGKILAVENSAVKISAGKNVGIRPGQVFSVFALGESIRCGTGRSLNLLEKRIGEIRTTAVMERYSLAVPQAEAPFSAGQVVRFKP